MSKAAVQPTDVASWLPPRSLSERPRPSARNRRTGYNDSGQVGDNSKTQRSVPVAVNTVSGVSALYGKVVVAIGAGYRYSLALCSDGTVAGWGDNVSGQLGDNTTGTHWVPVGVNTNLGISALYGKTVAAIAAGYYHTLALCSDGTAASWGYNGWGQLGDDTTTGRLAPVAVNTTPFATSQRFTLISSGCNARHSLAIAPGPSASGMALTSAQTLADGSFQFNFTNAAGAFFGVMSTTNPALPRSSWTPLDGLIEITPGQFQFTDPQATNGPRRLYRIRSP
jgi:hypothetical protein